jgi:hypothetical protein
MITPLRLASIGFLLLVIHSGVLAQGSRPSRNLDRLVIAEKEVGQSNGGATGDKPADPNRLWFALQMLAAEQAVVGETDAAIASFDRGLRAFSTRDPNIPPDDMNRINTAVAEDAIKAIVQEAKQRKVVILNEAHHVPLGRAFAARLAMELRKIGYEYLACEAFETKDGHVPVGPHGEVVIGTGLYTQEPVFAEFVNKAVADGWKPVPYEATGDGTLAQRERGQAQNLVDRIFSKNKNAKVFIYVGYDHVNKYIEGKGTKRMAAYLQELTGLDMLHVQQTNFFAHPDTTNEYAQYRYLVDKFKARQPFVLRAPDGSYPLLLGMQGVVDMQVIFPRYGLVNGRPEWMASLMGRQPRPIPADLLPTKGRRLIKAHTIGAAPDAVAADMVIVQAGQPVPSLMLPKGEYTYTVESD